MPTAISHLSDETRDEIASVALKLANTSKTRGPFQRLMKEALPGTPIPELDVADAMDERVKNERDAREKFEQEMRGRWQQEDLSRMKNEVRSKYELSEDDMTAMEKMMTEKKLPADYTWAAQLYKHQTETSTPTAYGSSGYANFDLRKNASLLDGLMDDTDNWSSRTAHGMIDEMHKAGKTKAF
jgi:hypothetical protein